MNILTFAKWTAEMAPAWVLALPEGLQRLCFQFFQVFIYEDRWKFFTDGLATTFIVTIGALVLGVIIGMIVAIIRSSHDSVRGKPNVLLRFFNAICKVYVTVLRGTPLMVQLLIMGFVIMVPKGDFETNLCAIITLGINSGAYVAEIARSGIMSIPAGQMEAGRSLGLNYAQTMRFIIIPQAFKNILPALGNELIALLKETSLVTVIALQDVTKAAQVIVSKTYTATIPYISLALIYLVLVMILTKLLGILERRLRESDKR
ncbi:MAG: amino acid ABC transporter permease [Oscillospiraceae bacterium]|nr:amino acid ABC transporter permease [Oscillospiraceae bacterium]